MKSLPQEIEIWYLIPAIRRELTRIFISDFGMNQKKASEILGITESAVSQYSKFKRGNELKFSESELKYIEQTSKEIIENGNANENIYKLCIKLRACQSLCELHKKQDKTISKDCDLCLT